MNTCLRSLLQYFFLGVTLLCSGYAIQAASPFEETKNLPIAYQGRFRSLDSAARLWLYDYYHKQQLARSDLTAFHAQDPSALELLWKFHFLGPAAYENAPLFWIHYAQVKLALDLDPTQDRFSYRELAHAQDKSGKEPTEEVHRILQAVQGYAEVPEQRASNKAVEALLEALTSQERTPQEIALTLEQRFPFVERLQNAGSTLKLLPSRQIPGEWLSLQAFKLRSYQQKSRQFTLIENFTTFTDAAFEQIRQSYFTLEAVVHKLDTTNNASSSTEELQSAVHNFVKAYNLGYASMANTAYKAAAGKQLRYPELWQLKVETLYYQLPLIELTICAYFCALFVFWGAYALKKTSLDSWALAILILGFSLHTTVLILRCYVLQRPPVSNMFETVIYVPWIALVIGLAFYVRTQGRLVLCAACLTSLALLILLKITHIDARLENVQAVLDSQYWLIVHVLMVVGSYGAFAVCGILAHFYLFAYWKAKQETPAMQEIAQSILHTMYVGVALLIPGTILGGIWAAESWGRFWDWDPKESWAFISACIYLLVVHAYTFKRIHDVGLAVGAIGGLIAISFTWYGVNYILGTGLHSYGFGNGGEGYYFLYLIVEGVFLIVTSLFPRSVSSR